MERVAQAVAGSPIWAEAAAQQERPSSPFPVLPDGWSVIGRCRFGNGGPGPHATGCHALAHPRVGIALIDIVPNMTPNAEARLRRALTAVEFWPDFPGTLPVVHDRLDAAALRSLPWALERWFAELPPLTVPGGSAWVEGVRRAMAVDPAWELSGQPKAARGAPHVPAEDGAAAAPAAPRAKRPARASAAPRGWGRAAVLSVAFASVFGLGLVAGVLILDSPSPVGQTAPTAAPPASAAPGPLAAAPAQAPKPAEAPAAVTAAPTGLSAPAQAPKPAEMPAASAAAPAGLAAPAEPPKPLAEAPAQPREPAAAVAAALAAANAAMSAPPPPARLEPALAPVGEAQPRGLGEGHAVRLVAGPASGGAVPIPPAEARVPSASQPDDALPMAPPRAPAPPVRVASSQPTARPAPVIDRACSQALFKFQQGDRLTAAEQNFIRTGCSTSRR